MAGLAVLLEDARYLFGIGDIGSRCGLHGPVDQATVGLRLGDAHLFPRQDILNGLRKIAARRLLPALAGAVLIVDSATIAQRELPIKNSDGGNTADAELFDQFLAGVLEDGEGEIAVVGMDGDAIEVL